MNQKLPFYVIIVGVLMLLNSCRVLNSGGGSQPQNIPQQRPTDGWGRAADPGVSVHNIELTSSYTIMTIQYVDRRKSQPDPNGLPYPTGTIAFHPNARLIAANGAREFKFIKAEGIPIEPQRRKTYGGDQILFKVYFERLDKGLENFDLFECNDYDHLTCWNIYGLKVNNPADVVVVNTPAPTTVPPISPPPPATTTPKPKKGEMEPPKTTPVPKPTPTPVPEAPSPVLVSGMVKDAKSSRPVSATIDYKISASKLSVDSVQSFANTGSYKMSLAKGQVYTYVVSAPGYLPLNDVLDLSKASAGQKITKDILLTPLTVGDKITLKNIYFEVGKADLLPASFSELDKLFTMMQDNPNMTIRLEGHTDIIGDKDLNLQLSRDRVKACQEYLVKKGTAWTRIEAVGYGDTRPIVSKGTDEQRKVNRRVEFVILKL